MPRSYNRMTKDQRDALIRAYNEDRDVYAVAESLAIRRDTAYRCIKRYLTGNFEAGDAETGTGTGRRTKVSQQVSKLLIQWIEDTPDITLKQMSEKLVENGFEKIHPSTIHRHLQMKLITIKKMQLHPARRNSAVTKQKRKDFVSWLQNQHEALKFVWVDETGNSYRLKYSFTHFI